VTLFGPFHRKQRRVARSHLSPLLRVIWALQNPSVSTDLFPRANSLPSRLRPHETTRCVTSVGALALPRAPPPGSKEGRGSVTAGFLVPERTPCGVACRWATLPLQPPRGLCHSPCPERKRHAKKACHNKPEAIEYWATRWRRMPHSGTQSMNWSHQPATESRPDSAGQSESQPVVPRPP
jgi:hypothetical protein